MEVALWSPLVVAAALLAAGSAAMMLLPEPAGQPLDDVVQASASHGLLARKPHDSTGSLRTAVDGGDTGGADALEERRGHLRGQGSSELVHLEAGGLRVSRGGEMTRLLDHPQDRSSSHLYN